MKKEKSDGFPSKQRISRRSLWGGRPQYLLSKPIPSDHNEQLQKALAGLQCCCYEVFVPFHFRLVLLCVCVSSRSQMSFYQDSVPIPTRSVSASARKPRQVPQNCAANCHDFIRFATFSIQMTFIWLSMKIQI